MKLIKAPSTEYLDYGKLRNTYKIFLAGTIDLGNSPDWQSTIVNELKDYHYTTIFNPRRDFWDKKDEAFQIEWELEHLKAADLIAMYLHPGSQSPVSLLELGLYINSPKLIVCCPDGYFRKNNVKLTWESTDRWDSIIETFDEFVETIHKCVRSNRG